MNDHGYNSCNYAAQINGTTVIIKAFHRANAVAFLQQKEPALNAKDVYIYAGITGSATIDEVYNDPVRVQSEKGNSWMDVYKVRMKEEYAHIV